MKRCSLVDIANHVLASRDHDLGETAWMGVRASLAVLAELGGYE
jgi:hypothetical protein